jgi:threonine dehydrogenase-like Zn-dependent dehydrogenase
MTCSRVHTRIPSWRGLARRIRWGRCVRGSAALGGTFSYPFAYGYACIGQVVESDQTVFAFHPHQDVFAARAGELIPLPAIDHASATLLPLVETALQVTLDAGTGYRERVIVLGAGVLGLLTALLLQRSGCRTLLAEPQPWRRHMVTSLGATAAAPEELAQQKVDRLPAARRGRYHGHAG